MIPFQGGFVILRALFRYTHTRARTAVTGVTPIWRTAVAQPPLSTLVSDTECLYKYVEKPCPEASNVAPRLDHSEVL